MYRKQKYEIFVKLIENESINPNDLTTNIFNVLDAKNAFDMIVSKNQDFTDFNQVSN